MSAFLCIEVLFVLIFSPLGPLKRASHLLFNLAFTVMEEPVLLAGRQSWRTLDQVASKALKSAQCLINRIFAAVQ